MTNVVAKYIPNTELEEFYNYPKLMQDEAKEWMGIVHRVETSGLSLAKAAANEAAKFAGKKGRSEDNIARKVRRYRKEGWRCCVNGSKKKGGEKSTLPLDFVEYWKDLCLDHQRGKIAPCFRELVRRWFNGADIPGYGTWRRYWDQQRPGVYFDTCPPDLPDGWTERNMRRYKPTAEELDLTQYGIAAALKHFPHVVRTRVGLRPLEWVAFDDFETDFMVTVPKVDKPVRLAALVAKDVATDMWLRFVLRPAIPRADGVKDGLKAKDMKRLIADLVMHFGYPVDYTMNLVFERGTATLPPDDVRALAEVTGGMVVGHPTSMITGQVLLSGFADKGVGKARSKGWIESGFNLLHNEYAMIPGQKGLSWQKAPMELETRVKYASRMLEAANQLDIAQYLQEAIPFPDVFEASNVLYTAFDRINRRTDHNLEGFEQIQRWRLSKGDPWKSVEEALQYPIEVRNHGMWKPFMETPVERFGRLMQGLSFERVPDSAVSHIMADHKAVTVANHQIEITIGKRIYRFFQRDCPYLVNDAKYLAYFDRNKLDCIYLTSPELDGNENPVGAFRCRLPRVDKVTQGDMDAAKKQIADNNHQLASVIRKINSRESREQKTRRKIANQQKAIQTLEEMQGINITQPNAPRIAEGSPVATGITESQNEIIREEQEREAELVRIKKSKTRISDIYQDDPPDDFEEEPEASGTAAPRLRDLYGSDDG